MYERMFQALDLGGVALNGAADEGRNVDIQGEAGKNQLSRDALRKGANNEDVFNSTNMSFGKEIEQI